MMTGHHPGETSSLGPARRSVVEFLDRHGVGPDVVERAALVVSELTTNAVEASPGRDYRLTVAVEADEVIIQVRNQEPEQALPPRGRWGPSELLSARGRGLAIVDALADRLVIGRSDGSIEITAVISAA